MDEDEGMGSKRGEERGLRNNGGTYSTCSFQIFERLSLGIGTSTFAQLDHIFWRAYLDFDLSMAICSVQGQA